MSTDGDPFEDWVADLTAVLDALGERPTILGNFDTGLVAIEFAARYPDRVGSLILVHCFARFVRGDDYPFGIDLATADALVDDSVETRPTGTSIDTLAFVAPSVATDSAFRSWWELIGRRAASPQTCSITPASSSPKRRCDPGASGLRSTASSPRSNDRSGQSGGRKLASPL